MNNTYTAKRKKKKKKNPVIGTEHISTYSGKGLGTYHNNHNNQKASYTLYSGNYKTRI